jgi:hypothetical protein
VIFNDSLYGANRLTLEKGHGQGFWRSKGRGFFCWQLLLSGMLFLIFLDEINFAP